MRLLAIVLLSGCTQLLPGQALCPPGQGPVVGSSEVQTLADGENHPVAIEALGGTLFWLDQGPPEQEVDEGSVVSRDLCSGVQHVLTRGQARPTALAIDAEGGFVYWVNTGRTNAGGSLCRVALDGDDQDARCLVTGLRHPSAIGRDGGLVYFAEKGDLATDGTWVPGTGAIHRFDPGTNAHVTLIDALDAPTGVAALDGTVTWTTEGRGVLVDLDGNGVLAPGFVAGTGAVERLSDGRRESIASGLDAPIAVEVTPSHTYWALRGVRRGSGGVYRDDAMIAGGLDFPGALALAPESELAFVAVTGAEDEEAEGHVSRFSLGAPELKVASSQQLPRGIAVDRHLVYWVDFGHAATPDGQVLVLSRETP